MSNSTCQTNPPIRHLLKKPEVAEVLGIGLRTLERMVASGGFPKADKHIGRMPRWRPETVETWIAGRR